MIRAEFFQLASGLIVGFKIVGHANFADYGKDIVCSAVSSSVRMCCNGLTEIAKVEANVVVENDEIVLKISEKVAETEVVQNYLRALELEIKLIVEDYGKSVKLIKTEV